MVMIFSESEPVARKKHNCVECNKPISPGEKYYCQVNDYDGFGTYKAHLKCRDLAIIVNKGSYYDDWCLLCDIPENEYFQYPGIEQIFKEEV